MYEKIAQYLQLKNTIQSIQVVFFFFPKTKPYFDLVLMFCTYVFPDLYIFLCYVTLTPYFHFCYSLSLSFSCSRSVLCNYSMLFCCILFIFRKLTAKNSKQMLTLAAISMCRLMCKYCKSMPQANILKGQTHKRLISL